MDMKKTAIAVVAGFVLQMGGSDLLHSVILMNSYIDTKDLWRTEDAMEPSHVGHDHRAVSISLGAVLIYQRGVEEKVPSDKASATNLSRFGEHSACLADRVRHRSRAAHHRVSLDHWRRNSVRATRNSDCADLPTERFSGLKLFTKFLQRQFSAPVGCSLNLPHRFLKRCFRRAQPHHFIWASAQK